MTVEYRGTPAPSISWYKDGLEIFSGRRHRIITENGSSTLIIHQTALSDEGEIKCTATNRVGHAVTKATLRTEGERLAFKRNLIYNKTIKIIFKREFPQQKSYRGCKTGKE